MRSDGQALAEELAKFYAELKTMRVPGFRTKGTSDWVESQASWFPRGLAGPGGLTDTLSKPYAQSGTLHRGVKVLADVVSSIPREFFLGDSDEPLPRTDPIVKVFGNPNEKYSGNQLIGKTVQDLVLTGNAVWVLDEVAGLDADRRSTKFPNRLWPLQMLRTRPDVSPVSGEHLGWISGSGTRTRRYLLDETVHFFFENPYDEVLGLSEVAPVMHDLLSAFSALLTNVRMMKRGGPGVVLERTELGANALFGTEGEDRLKRELDEGFQDEDEHTAELLPPGYRLAKAGATQREMDFEKLLRLNRENVAGSIGVPPSVVGVLEYANYANMGPQLEYLFHFAAFPLVSRIESTIQSRILDRFGTNVRIYFKVEAVRALFENLDRLSQIADRFLKMGFTRRAINDRLELGFDLSDDPEADTSYLASGIVPAELAGQLGGGSFAPAASYRARSNGDLDPELRERQRTILWRSTVAKVSDIEAGLYRGVRGIFNDVERQVVARLRRNKSALRSFTKDLIEEVTFDYDEVLDAFKEIARPAWAKALERGGRAVLSEVEAGIRFDVADERALDFLARKEIRIKEPVDTLREAVRSIVEDGVAAGKTIDDIAADLEGYFSAVSRARVIARTETISAFSGGRNVGMHQAEVELHEWLSARDDRVRESHTIDGQTVGLEEPFVLKPDPERGLGVERLMYPTDDSRGASPSNIIQCRCVELPALK